MYLDFLNEAKLFALLFTQASKKECNFDVRCLAFSLNKRFREFYPEIEIVSDHLVKSIESCRVDLLKWGAKYDSNKNRPNLEVNKLVQILPFVGERSSLKYQV
ncbi:hypothetical protein BpHYR1_041289 [Brachionus plicatilis]|uniref:Uncharacterized protein n=1 Tax=Brachionus plicatilis TaxID=10195 RepID=A0A3M7QF92_BRAPC|nr:hypothetical protein BpHYR1_041289 [Brachionus plicatilis]